MRSSTGGRAIAMIAALATVVLGFAVSTVPWSPWSTAFLLVAPAVPAVVLWRALEPWVRLLLAGAVAVVVAAVVAQVMLLTGRWSPSGGVASVAVVSALLWVANAATWDVMAGGQRKRGS